VMIQVDQDLTKKVNKADESLGLIKNLGHHRKGSICNRKGSICKDPMVEINSVPSVFLCVV
jgi:hypothetical protein